MHLSQRAAQDYFEFVAGGSGQLSSPAGQKIKAWLEENK